jgi:hypothetical protein
MFLEGFVIIQSKNSTSQDALQSSRIAGVYLSGRRYRLNAAGLPCGVDKE